MIYPKQVIFDPTNRCNLSCKGCYRKDFSLDVTFMDFSLFTKIIQELWSWGTYPDVVISGYGEALLHPDIAKMFLFATTTDSLGKFLKCSIATNGTVERKDLLDIMFDRPERVGQFCVSLDGFSLSRKNFRGSDSLQPGYLVEDIIKHNRLGKEGKDGPSVPLAVSMVRSIQSWEEVERFILYFLSFGVKMVIIRHEEDLSRDARGFDRYRCHHLNGRSICLHPDGHVGLCPRTGRDVIIGDAREESLLSIYNGEKMRPYRDHFPNDVCQRCPVPFSGLGIYGEVEFKDWPGTKVYMKQDHYNQVFSLEDTRKGLGWEEEEEEK